MSLIIDTSVLISLEKGDKTTIKLLEDLMKTYPSPPNVAFINYFEFLYGLHERNPKNKADAINFIDLFHFLEPTKKTASILSDLKYKYEKQGKPFSLSDLLVASQSIENNMILVSKDKQFEEIEELKKVIL